MAGGGANFNLKLSWLNILVDPLVVFDWLSVLDNSVSIAIWWA